MSSIEPYILFAIIFLLSLSLNYIFYRTWKIKRITILRSVVKSDRWGTNSVPMTGGIAIVMLLVVFSLYYAITKGLPYRLTVVIGGSIAIFFLGLIDDLFELKSYQKLLGQVIITLLIISLGVQVYVFGNIFDSVITFFWILGITNAINLLDNMDGLAGGISLIALIFLAISFYHNNTIYFFFFSMVLAAAILGFLIFNFKPAKVYLGDNGALFIGFIISSLIAISADSPATGKALLGVLIFPVFLLLIPIFDTVLVSITRRFRGQSPFQGGKDHLSHRLVKLGMSERQAVITLYVISALIGLLFYVLKDVRYLPLAIICLFLSIFIILFGLYIGKIKITGVDDTEDERTFFRFGGKILFKRQILSIIIDVILIGVIYYLSYLIRFGGEIAHGNVEIFKQSLPFIILIKIILLSVFKVYDIDITYLSFADALKIFKSVSLASFGAVLIFTFWYRFQGYSRAIFIIDWLLSLFLLGGIRVFYRFFDEMFYPLRVHTKKKTVFVGTYNNYKLIESILRIKKVNSYNLAKHIDAENIERDLDKIEDVELVIIQDDILETLHSENHNSLKEERYTVVAMFDIISQLIKKGS